MLDVSFQYPRMSANQVNITVESVRERLKMLKAEFENCRGGGYVGRLKQAILADQIQSLESVLARADENHLGLRGQNELE